MADINNKWSDLQSKLEDEFNKVPDLNAILFLVGVQELGQGNKSFSKEEKQDLIHIGLCKVLSLGGYFKLKGKDQDGWPVWEKSDKISSMKIEEQEEFIKFHVLQYFEELGL